MIILIGLVVLNSYNYLIYSFKIMYIILYISIIYLFSLVYLMSKRLLGKYIKMPITKIPNLQKFEKISIKID